MELKIRADRAVSDVVLSFLLPGGLEVENPSLATSGAAAETRSPDREGDSEGEEEADGEDYAEESSPAQRSGLYLDLREDRLLLFLDGLYGGPVWTTHAFTMRAVSRGTFTVPPLAAEGMYNPEINVIGKSAKVIIE